MHALLGTSNFKVEFEPLKVNLRSTDATLKLFDASRVMVLRLSRMDEVSPSSPSRFIIAADESSSCAIQF